MKTKVLIAILLYPFILCSAKEYENIEQGGDNVTDSLIIPTPLLSSDFTSSLFFNYTKSHGLPNEGFAVYGNYAFALYLTGICDIYDLNTKQFVNSFHLGSYSSTNHANVADFGIEFPEGNRDFPAMYVSECLNKRRCFVEDITTTGSKLIQTISVDSVVTGKMDFLIDRKRKLIYVVSSSGTTYNIIAFRLPQLSEGNNVVLTGKDIFEKFAITAKGTPQGLFIYNGYMYSLMSGPNNLYEINLTNPDHEVSIINFEPNFPGWECEDLYLYQNYLLISFNGGGVYSFKNNAE